MPGRTVSNSVENQGMSTSAYQNGPECLAPHRVRAAQGLYNNPDRPTVDDAFNGIAEWIYISKLGGRVVKLTLTWPDGSPAQNVAIKGLKDVEGNTLSTDATGTAIGKVDSLNATLTIDQYIDITPQNISVTAPENTLTPVSHQIPQSAFLNFVAVTGTKNAAFSQKCTRVDLSLCGGGGDGGSGDDWRYTNGSTYYYPGGGGGGGEVLTISKASFAPNTMYTFTVGGSGGASSALGHTARGGGNGGDAGAYSNIRGAPGTGYSGNGAGWNSSTKKFSAAQSSSKTIYASFTTTKTVGGGGGAGTPQHGESGVSDVTISGTPNGGAGGTRYVDDARGQNGGVGGGGGGGSAYFDAEGEYAGAGGGYGGRGEIALRMWH